MTLIIADRLPARENSVLIAERERPERCWQLTRCLRSWSMASPALVDGLHEIGAETARHKAGSYLAVR